MNATTNCSRYSILFSTDSQWSETGMIGFHVCVMP